MSGARLIHEPESFCRKSISHSARICVFKEPRANREPEPNFDFQITR